MQTVREFSDDTAKLSLRQFWLATGPILAGVLLLTVLVVIWKRQWAIDLRSRVWKRWCQSRCGAFIMESVWPPLCSIGRLLRQLVRRFCLGLFCCSCTDDSLPRHHTGTTSSVAPAPSQPTPQPSGSGQGGSIPLVPVQRPPPGSLSSQQQFPTRTYSASPTSTSDPNGASVPPSSAGRPVVPPHLQTSGRSSTHAP